MVRRRYVGLVVTLLGLALIACSRADGPAPGLPLEPPFDPVDPEIEARDLAHTPLELSRAENVPTAPVPPPRVGERAPGGVVVGPDGRTYDLSSTYELRPAVIVFYRSGACASCRDQLRALQRSYDELLGAGAELYVISVDTPADSAAIRDELNLGYAVLSDRDAAVVQSWGVYDREHGIAEPAVFVVGPGGDVLYRSLGTRVEDRFPVADITRIIAP